MDIPAPKNMKTFFVIWIGQVISMIGSGLTGFALGVYIFEKTHQATPFTVTVLIASLPRILLSPLAGSLADRWNRRWIMILSDTFSALVTLAAVLLMFSGELEVWHIYLIALFNSIFGAFQEPAYTASITMLVPKKDLARASGLMQAIQPLEMLVAPLLAGVLFVWIGMQGIFLIDFITFFFAIGALLIVQIPQPAIARDEQTGGGVVLKDMAFGFNYLRERPGLFGLLMFFALVNFLVNFAAVLMGPLVLSNNSASAYGAVQMVSGLAMLAGSIALGVWGGPKRRINGVFGFIFLAGIGLLIAGLHPHAAMIGAGLAISLGVVPLAAGPAQAIFQTKVEPSVQGRVFAVRSMISRSMMPLAFAISGPLADYFFVPLLKPGGALSATFVARWLGDGDGRGIGLMYVLSALVLLVSTGLVYCLPHIRNVETDLPDMIASEEGAPADQPFPVVEPDPTPAM